MPIENSSPRPGSRKIAAWAVALAALATLLVLGHAYPTFPGDEQALDSILKLRAEWLNDGAVFISAIGSGGLEWGGIPWIPIALVAGLLASRQWGGSVFLAAATLAPVVNLGLKELVARPRPDVQLALVAESGYAFPSGHAVFVAAFFGALIVLLGRWTCLVRRPMLRLALQAALALLILAVGVSRVYLGVHWPSDVIAGFLFGGLYLCSLVIVRSFIEIWRYARVG